MSSLILYSTRFVHIGGIPYAELFLAQDRPAAQVIREFMREYVAKHKAATSKDKTEPSNDALAPAEASLKREAQHGRA